MSESPPWHALTAEEVLARLEASEHGLSAAEAARRRKRYGRNVLPEPERPSALKRFLLQFHNLLIYVLLVAGTITLLLGLLVDAAVIYGVVLVNAIIGFIQEGRAEQAMQAVRALLAPEATVVRDGHRVVLPAEQLVPGDLVVVQAGDRVPADLRLVRARSLQVSEAVLTGESLPVEKDPRPVEASAPLGDRRCMLFSGTFVTRGQGTGVVVGTGTRTEIGRIGVLLETVGERRLPLLAQLARFARQLTALILTTAGATMAFGILVHGFPLADMFLAAVAIAVAAIPEGLPAIVTIILAIGVERMARRHAIVRRLPAVETLGSVSVICSDKTGTFTKNEMTVDSIALSQRFFEVTGTGYEPHGEIRSHGVAIDPESEPSLILFLRAGLLCNEASVEVRDGSWVAVGDPMEAALVVAAMKAGFDPQFERRAWPRVDEIPFDAEHRFMATLHHDHEGHAVIWVKGAPERLFEMCRYQAGANGEPELFDLDCWAARLDQLASRGARVLAVAMKPVEPQRAMLSFDDLRQDVILLGLVGMLDPPRPEAIEAVARCRAAGIRVKMVTGDHAATACAVAERLGLENPRAVLTGTDLERLAPAELERRVETVDVFARTAPEHKLRLVEALQRRGRIVAMTGDGVNDAPALRRADIGIAMGRKGTEAAKEAAEIVLADDNFVTIAYAVEEGRTVYDNIKKALIFILPTNAAQALIAVIAIAIGLILPVSPVQILWVNMVTSVTLALALAFEPTEPDAMRRPPRDPRETLVSGLLLLRLVYVPALTVAVTFAVFFWREAAGAPLEEARTAAVNVLVAAQMWYLFAVRRFSEAAFSRTALRTMRPALAAVAILILLQLAFTHLKAMQLLFRTHGLDVSTWLVILAAGTLPLFAVEIEKAAWSFVRRPAAIGQAEGISPRS